MKLHRTPLCERTILLRDVAANMSTLLDVSTEVELEMLRDLIRSIIEEHDISWIDGESDDESERASGS